MGSLKFNRLREFYSIRILPRKHLHVDLKIEYTTYTRILVARTALIWIRHGDEYIYSEVLSNCLTDISVH